MTLSLRTSALLLMAAATMVEGFSPTLRSTPRTTPTTTTLLSSATSPSSFTAEEQRASEIFFDQFDDDSHQGQITLQDLGHMLQSLDIDATEEEQAALFAYLDADGSGLIDFELEFLPWYKSTVEASREQASVFQALLLGRRTVETFDQTPVGDDVLKRAIQCAIAAPNRSGSEPWRFIKVGPETVQQLKQLNDEFTASQSEGGGMESAEGTHSTVDWTSIPGWCVTTCQLDAETGDLDLDDFKSTCCAVQNFMLSMWSEGIGSKWTAGPVQKTPEFAKLVGVDPSRERVVGCIWYGFASGGLVNADPKRRVKTVDDVLSTLP